MCDRAKKIAVILWWPRPIIELKQCAPLVAELWIMACLPRETESQHIQTLTKEWEKREKERENVLNSKMSEILLMEKDLKKALEQNKSKQKSLKSFEEELIVKEKKLDEREERLQNLLGNNRSKVWISSFLTSNAALHAVLEHVFS